MRILLTGATGYIGKRLLPVLQQQGHQVICCVRNAARFHPPAESLPEVVVVDFLDLESLKALPRDIDAAYYLIHSMSVGNEDFQDLEEKSARNFIQYLQGTTAQQVVYLSGIVNETDLSKHLDSRKNVEDILKQGRVPLTVLRAGIVVGSGSASFEIIRDLVEKLPVMITPRWVLTRCQPIAIRDVIRFLIGVLNNSDCFNKDFDIGGQDILTYKEMLLQYARVRKLKRRIWTLPVMTPRLSSYWLYFITSTSYPLAVHLVDSMKIEVVCRDKVLQNLVGIEPLRYSEAIEAALGRIQQNVILSSWKDALSSGRLEPDELYEIKAPEFGCFRDTRTYPIGEQKEQVFDNLWQIGGNRGWYYANWLWRFRGFLDKLFGGVGLNRGRRHPLEIEMGDSLDFWRVLKVDRRKGYLLLFAEMRLPGEAWLEFSIQNSKGQSFLQQTAVFRPRGLWGRLYWYATKPIHFFLFRGMIRNIVSYREVEEKTIG